jgi:hypothetical protein
MGGGIGEWDRSHGPNGRLQRRGGRGIVGGLLVYVAPVERERRRGGSGARRQRRAVQLNCA